MKSFWKSRNLFSKRFLAAGGRGKRVLIEAQDGQPKRFFSSFLLSVHPEYWLVDPHGGHKFFQIARAVRELKRRPSGEFMTGICKFWVQFPFGYIYYY
ncbi:MAG: hypothetical protein GTO45_17865 [Candidatus Aminicenantes bacterium]|nr:hypothetical protein [Candidatus Aminicenantes bacterium]NIM80646.1 hypothetical protein [Candidatus Aminicenantes bacterium]NIN20027.1 hypothetical protein [Candidatus Aminicenantes bacterium]NIN43815.1 hypothetical protein [Candidatus Aminicenantes bacterium]NIN86625.1 hypothetical protein [Candidatus Aminicenantes bacterium]